MTDTAEALSPVAHTPPSEVAATESEEGEKPGATRMLPGLQGKGRRVRGRGNGRGEKCWGRGWGWEGLVRGRGGAGAHPRFWTTASESLRAVVMVRLMMRRVS